VRRIVGLVLFVTGALLLGYVGGTYGRGYLAAERARRAWEAAEAHAAVAMARDASNRRAFPSHLAPGAPVARLLIPSIGLDEVVVEGVEDESLLAGPGHLPGSPFPGETGNAIISAHRDRHFHGLGALQVGDTIITDTGQRRMSWIVTSTRVVDKDARALFSTREPTLTLTTCWPIRYLGAAPDRLLVRAVPIKHWKQA
jgi:sortase A